MEKHKQLYMSVEMENKKFYLMYFFRHDNFLRFFLSLNPLTRISAAKQEKILCIQAS